MSRRWRLPLIGVAITLLWQFVLYPLLVAGGGPKAFAYHRASVSALGVTMIGWTGLHVRTPFVANLVVVAVVIVCTGTSLMARTGGVASIAAAVIVGQLAVLIASIQFLDVSINLREERHVIIVRFMIVVLIVVAINRVGEWLRPRVPQRLERWRVAAPVVLVALVAALAANGWPWPSRGLLPREDFSDGRAILDRYSNLPVVSNQTESWYMMTGTPAADLPRTAEMTSLAPRDDEAEVAAMSRAVADGYVLQAYRKGFWETMNLRDYPCVVVVEDEPLLESLFQLSILDISGCR